MYKTYIYIYIHINIFLHIFTYKFTRTYTNIQIHELRVGLGVGASKRRCAQPSHSFGRATKPALPLSFRADTGG